MEDADGNWWAVCLGIRPLAYPFRHNLGRETMLVPAKWENGWLYAGENGAVLPEFTVAHAPKAWAASGYVPGSAVTDEVQGETLHPMWNLIYNPVPGLVQCTGNGLELHGNGVSLWEDAPKAWLGRRQEHFCCTAETELAFVPGQEGEEAGLTVYMNPGHHYEIARTMRDGVDCIILRRRIGALCAVEKAVPCHGGTVSLRLSCDRYWYRFAFAEDGGAMQEIGAGETQYLTTEAGGCFTGNYIALYASGNGTDMTAPAKFRRFSYVPTEE